MLEVRIMATLVGEGWVVTKRKNTAGFWNAYHFCFLIWVLITQVCSVCENSLG